MYTLIEEIIKKINNKILKFFPSLKRYTTVDIYNFASIILVTILIFILSGGITLVINPNLRAFLTSGVSGSESPLEFTLFFSVNYISFLSLYMITRGFRRGKLDNMLIVVGIILFIITILINWFLLIIRIRI